LLAAAALSVPSAVAHPPANPFDTTIFAPIQPGGFQVDLESVATGLTAPLKGEKQTTKASATSRAATLRD
jgi:hypothetical protein